MINFNVETLKEKKILIVSIPIALVIGIVYLVDYNSVESRCKRHYQGLGSMLGAGDSKLSNLQLQAASKSLIQKCINEKGPK